jgi:RND family efflux transporter MFP subunit
VRANNADDRSTARESVQVTAAFDDRPNSRYPLTFKEIATRADTATQTFEVTYLMDQWDGGAVLPGMTASVTVDLGDYVTQTQIYTVPVSAVVGDYKLDPRVWVVDESNMTVTPRSVRVGRLIGNGIEIIDGLEPGVRIVTAGTPFLTEDMSVTLMPNLEQAAPRTDDLKHP